MYQSRRLNIPKDAHLQSRICFHRLYLDKVNFCFRNVSKLFALGHFQEGITLLLRYSTMQKLRMNCPTDYRLLPDDTILFKLLEGLVLSVKALFVVIYK